MQKISEMNKYKKKDLTLTLRKSFMLALKDEKFVKLVNRLDVDEETLIKYTTKLENTVSELNNCSGCKGISHCKNRVTGYVSYPEKQNNGLVFSYIPCKYQKELSKIKNTVTFFETPKFLREAKMKDLYLNDKRRIEVIKYAKKFIDSYKNGKKIKGLYLYGSFGSGKSYIINALLNELGKEGVICISVYYPSLLKTLKEGFKTNYEERLKEIIECDVLLLDDIGAENNTAWARDEILGTILQYRMDNGLSTFFTSNLNLEELEEHLKTTTNSTDKIKARRIIERIKQLTEPIELVSENLRK